MKRHKFCSSAQFVVSLGIWPVQSLVPWGPTHKHFKFALAFCWAALSGSSLLIATFSTVVLLHLTTLVKCLNSNPQVRGLYTVNGPPGTRQSIFSLKWDTLCIIFFHFWLHSAKVKQHILCWIWSALWLVGSDLHQQWVGGCSGWKDVSDNQSFDRRSYLRSCRGQKGALLIERFDFSTELDALAIHFKAVSV